MFPTTLLDKFIKSRPSGTSPKTIGVYHLALDNFVGYPITPEDINAYLNSLSCGNAKHNYYRIIKTLCRWLYYTDQIASNPIDRVLPPRRQRRHLKERHHEKMVEIAEKGNQTIEWAVRFTASYFT